MRTLLDAGLTPYWAAVYMMILFLWSLLTAPLWILEFLPLLLLFP